MGERFYVAETFPSCEVSAKKHLERQGFVVYMPTLLSAALTKEGVVDKIVPMFPSYLITPLDLDQSGWHSINGTYGVKRLVSFGGAQPVPLRDDAAAQIVQICQNGPVPDPTALFRNISRGDTVEVVGGPLTGHRGTVRGLTKRRAEILLSLFAATASLPLSALIRIPR